LERLSICVLAVFFIKKALEAGPDRFRLAVTPVCLNKSTAPGQEYPRAVSFLLFDRYFFRPEAASHAELSPDCFCLLFKQRFHIPPYEFRRLSGVPVDKA
jgi:hypothetical protein